MTELSSAANTKSVAILLCAMNGESFLAEQLDSFEKQTHRNWKLWISDDGSTDQTLSVARRYAGVWGGDRLTIVAGPRKGYAANFLSLICRPEIQADYYALSDQDDIWLPEKMETALEQLAKIPDHVPALYCARTQLVDERGAKLGLSPLFNKPPSFRHALVQSLAGGNTMVMNAAACALIRKAGADSAIPSHDWWIYMAVSGCGGVVLYDPVPKLLYRQHGRNIIGANQGLRAKIRRLRQLLKGQHRDYADRHITALQRVEDNLTPSNRACLETFQQARQAPLLQRLWDFARLGLYRQTFMGNLTLWLAIVLRKV